MVTLDWTVDAVEGYTLVELVLRNPDPVSRRVRVANRLTGRVLPPRRRGVPEAGWDDGGYEGVIEAGGRLALGYATDCEPTDEPPAELVWEERSAAVPASSGHDDAPSTSGHDDVPTVTATPAGVVRALGDPTPPADAVPLPSVDEVESEEGENGGDNNGEDDDRDDPALPEAVVTWLSAVETRVDRCEALANATALDEAAREVEREGGLAAVETTVEALDADRRALRALERRVSTLRERADATTNVPLEPFRRLA